MLKILDDLRAGNKCGAGSEIRHIESSYHAGFESHSKLFIFYLEDSEALFEDLREMKSSDGGNCNDIPSLFEALKKNLL